MIPTITKKDEDTDLAEMRRRTTLPNRQLQRGWRTAAETTWAPWRKSHPWTTGQRSPDVAAVQVQQRSAVVLPTSGRCRVSKTDAAADRLLLPRSHYSRCPTDLQVLPVVRSVSACVHTHKMGVLNVLMHSLLLKHPRNCLQFCRQPTLSICSKIHTGMHKKLTKTHHFEKNATIFYGAPAQRDPLKIPSYGLGDLQTHIQVHRYLFVFMYLFSYK